MDHPEPQRRGRRLEAAARRFRQVAASGPSPPREGWVRATRKALGMSQAQLAARAGISRATVQKLERAETRRRITLASLDRLAAALGCEFAIALLPAGGSLAAVRERAAREKVAALLASAAGAMSAGVRDAVVDAVTPAAAVAPPEDASPLAQALVEELLRGSPRKLWR